MSTQITTELMQGALPILWNVLSGFASVAVVIAGFFFKRLAKRFDAFTDAVNSLKEFVAVQMEKNKEIDEIKDDLKETQKRVNRHDVRIGQLEKTNELLNKSGAN